MINYEANNILNVDFKKDAEKHIKNEFADIEKSDYNGVFYLYVNDCEYKYDNESRRNFDYVRARALLLTDERRIKEIKNELTNQNDGQVTKFVVLYRAMLLVETGKFNPEEITNVLDQVLENFENIDSNEFNNNINL